MALPKQQRPLTAEEKRINDRIRRARAVKSPVDRTSNHIEALGDLARQTGVRIDLLVEEWSERAAVREYCGGVTKAEAEEAAMDDVRERFIR